MEWVEVRGETVDEAEELALDQLGVAREDAEFEIVQSPESRWLGLKRVEARVRARVKPTAPRPKAERGGRRRGGSGGGDRQGQRKAKAADNGAAGSAKKDARGSRRGGGGKDAQSSGGRKSGGSSSRSREDRSERTDRKDDRRDDQRDSRVDKASKRAPKDKEQTVSSDENDQVPVAEQQQVVSDFLQGIVDGFGLDASVQSTLDEDTIVGSIDGTSVGLLVGPKAGTLRAVQELARTVMQRHAEGRDTNRLVIDVAGYRERRRSALEAFTRAQAEKVIESGASVALEPMTSADRKIVHDVAAEIEGVSSSSAGEDPNRHVVLGPA
jgi:spoIIIJ-associated protein